MSGTPTAEMDAVGSRTPCTLLGALLAAAAG
jgi:hypothetical protein